MKSLQRSFLWGGPKKERKWVFVTWNKIFLPKYHGDLRVRDLKTLNKVLARKIQ